MGRAAWAIATLVALLPEVARAQANGDRAISDGGPGVEPWTLTLSLATYVLPDAPDYFQPTVGFDSGPLHVEGRYDYEDHKTGSLFAGWEIGFGEGSRFTITPMVGVVLGQTTGLAPGLALDLALGPFQLSTENEYLVDIGDAGASFFYSWTEVVAPLGDLFRAGLVVERTKVFRTPAEVAIGPWFGASFWKADLALYLFDPLDEARYLVVSAALTF